MQLFQFENVAAGTTLALSAMYENGQAWFIARDVCKALDIHRTGVTRLDADEKGLRLTLTPGGPQQVGIINESGLYRLICSSKKPAAQGFRKWVTSVVLPAIHKHGGYINGQEAQSAPEQAQTFKAVHAEAIRVGMNAEEEKQARYDTFRFMRTGRR